MKESLVFKCYCRMNIIKFSIIFYTNALETQFRELFTVTIKLTSKINPALITTPAYSKFRLKTLKAFITFVPLIKFFKTAVEEAEGARRITTVHALRHLTTPQNIHKSLRVQS